MTAAASRRPRSASLSSAAARGGIRRRRCSRANRRAVVESDVAGLAHVHGYNLDVSLAPGVPARLEFVADVAGRFEVELHGDVEVQIADLSVLP